MENSFKQLIDQSKSVLVILPTKPYFDQVAAGLALFLALRGDRNIQIAAPSPMTVEFNRLIGVNKISQEVGNKNLVIRFTDYKANDIERVSYDIEDGQFRLSVIPKDQLNPPTQDQVELAYSGVSADLVVLIGGANESHFPMLSKKEFSGAQIVHIGTKDLVLSGKQIMSFSRPAASTSEVIAALLRDNAIPVDEDAATNLIMGIEEATNNFSDENLGAETFELLAGLMRAGGRRGARSGASPSSYPPGAIPGMPVRTQVPAAWQPQGEPKSPQQAPQQPQPQQSPQSPAQSVAANEEPENSENEQNSDEAPQDWLQPKIFKGTSVK